MSLYSAILATKTSDEMNSESTLAINNSEKLNKIFLKTLAVNYFRYCLKYKSLTATEGLIYTNVFPSTTNSN